MRHHRNCAASGEVCGCPNEAIARLRARLRAVKEYWRITDAQIDARIREGYGTRKRRKS